MPRRRLIRAAHLAALILLAVLLVSAARRLDLARAANSLADVRLGWVALAIACYLAILPLWAAQWVLLSPPVGRPTLGRMLGVVSMTSSVLNTAPMFVGEAAGVVFLVTRGGLDRAAALSVLAMDQVVVGMAKVALLVTASLMVDLPLWAARGLAGLAATVATCLLLLLLASGRGDALGRAAGRVLPPRLAQGVARAAHALAPLRSPALAGGALLLAFAKKAAEVVAIVCIQRAFGLSLPLGAAVLVLAALSLSTLLPVVPGNVGVYEATAMVVYARFGVPAEQALALAVVQHACFFAALALPGYRWLARAAPRRRAEAAS